MLILKLPLRPKCHIYKGGWGGGVSHSINETQIRYNLLHCSDALLSRCKQHCIRLQEHKQPSVSFPSRPPDSQSYELCLSSAELTDLLYLVLIMRVKKKKKKNPCRLMWENTTHWFMFLVYCAALGVNQPVWRKQNESTRGINGSP